MGYYINNNMSIVKSKSYKKIPNDNRCTLDVKHNEQLKTFNSINEKKIENKIKRLENEYNELDDIDNLDKKNNIFNEISILKDKIDKNKNIKNDYYLNTSHLLFKYYDIKNKDNTIENSIENNNENVLNNVSLESFEHNFTNINKYIDKKVNSDKADILDKYLNIVDENYIKNDFKNNRMCSYCNNKNLISNNDGLLVCTECGTTEYTFVENEKPSYKDPPVETNYFCYKRINHFNELLAQFQAKEVTIIPEEVLDAIYVEIKKERIKDMKLITNSKIRQYLKKLKLSKYYEHIPYIVNKISGKQSPIMSREIEDKLRLMFKEIQIPFAKACPSDRKNFLNYNYIIHKFVELLELDDFIDCFPLLKSREKLYQQDQIWKKICDELQWEFIASL